MSCFVLLMLAMTACAQDRARPIDAAIIDAPIIDAAIIDAAIIDADLSDADKSCPPELPADGECSTSGPYICTWERDGGRPITCTCTTTGWRCSTCPGDFQDPSATCTPGERCTYEDWEHGCNCTCSPEGHWDCIPETIGSVCRIEE